MPPKKDNYMYVSQMNMTDLKKIAEKETIDISGLNMKEIKDKIASDTRNFPKKFDVNTQKWSTRLEDASTYTGSTMGESLERPEEMLKILSENMEAAKETEIRLNAFNKLKTFANNKKMSKSQLLEKISMMELEDEKKGVMRNIKKQLDTATKNEQEPAATPVSTPASTPPPTPKNSPAKTDDTRDYKKVNFQGLTKDENSNAKVKVKMARVQITKSDIEKELERQNNRRFGFQHNKISYNTHWGSRAGKISSELI